MQPKCLALTCWLRRPCRPRRCCPPSRVLQHWLRWHHVRHSRHGLAGPCMEYALAPAGRPSVTPKPASTMQHAPRSPAAPRATQRWRRPRRRRGGPAAAAAPSAAAAAVAAAVAAAGSLAHAFHSAAARLASTPTTPCYLLLRRRRPLQGTAGAA
eukprot:365057-Chlamydomonas_euryale.AAC.2